MDPRDLSPAQLARVGHLAAAGAAILIAIAGFATLSVGPGRAAGASSVALDVEPVVATIAAVAFIVVVGATFLTWNWMAPLAAFATTAAATAAGVEVLRGRISDAFAPGAHTDLRGGGVLLTLAFWILVVAVIVQAYAAYRRGVDTAIDRAQSSPEHERGSTGRGTLGLVMSLVGVIMPVFSGLGVTLSLEAFGEYDRDGSRPGRGTALAGVVFGVIGLSLLVALLGAGAFVMTPPAA